MKDVGKCATREVEMSCSKNFKNINYETEKVALDNLLRVTDESVQSFGDLETDACNVPVSNELLLSSQEHPFLLCSILVC